MGLRTFTPVGGLLWYKCPPVSESPGWVTNCWVAVMGFDFTVIAPLLPSHCGFSFVFGCGVSFLVSFSVFLSMIVQQLVVIPVLLQEAVIRYFDQHVFKSSMLNILLKLSGILWEGGNTSLQYH